MEAATPLRPPHVRTIGDRLVLDGVVVDDECAVRLVREREEAGEDPLKLVVDAIGIGARVLDREQAGANAEFVKTEFQSVAREVEHEFGERARAAAEVLDRKVTELFGPDNGHLQKALERHFSDGSSTAVQHRVREVVNEAMARAREDLLRQFSAADGRNPLADFKASTVEVLKRADERQDANLRALHGKLGELERELQALRDERAKREELEAERDRGTAKGRAFEEVVAEVLDELASGRGDVCEAVGDVRGASGRKGDVVISIDACTGPARGRIVFEAKNSQLSRPKALAELDEALADRAADFAVLVVSSEEKVPARTQPLREYNGDKLVVAYDPEEGSRLALEVAYSLARARVLMARAEGEGIDAAAVRDTVERALNALEDVRKIKQQLTGIGTAAAKTSEMVEAIAQAVRAQLKQVDALVAEAEPQGGE
jgi:hypothetical protein